VWEGTPTGPGATPGPTRILPRLPIQPKRPSEGSHLGPRPNLTPAAPHGVDQGGSAITLGPRVDPPRQTDCSVEVTDGASLSQALSNPTPGARICISGNLGSIRLEINKGGTPEAPISVIGNGQTATLGISVDASNVVVNGIRAVNGAAPGISLKGNNITLQNSSSIDPQGGDGDGIRFWGDNIQILHNTISGTRNLGGAHADCMQTYATNAQSPASHHIVIDGNRCEKIDNQCLIAEGPHSSAGDGSGQGQSSDLTFTNNYCQVGASQATEIDDVQGVKIAHNLIAGTTDKAFSFQNKSTDAVVTANKLDAGIGYEVGMDPSSQQGYQGPKIGGAP
jgi:hypothetical protein